MKENGQLESSGKAKASFDELVSLVEDYAVFTLDPGGVILDWNRGAQQIKLYTPQEIIGCHFSKFYTEEDLAAEVPAEELRVAIREGRVATEGWRLRRDGRRFWASVTITAIRSREGSVEGFLKITRDLTERMLAEESLRQSEERFHLLLESVQDHAIFMIDPEGHVLTWNAGARRIKGYEQQEIIGRHFSTFYPPEALAVHRPAVLMRAALQEGRAEDEGWRLRKDGSRFWANVMLTALHDPRGELRGFAKVTRDLTERRQVESLREAGQRKDVFLATLAHELRNPLAPILPGLEVILAAPGDDATVTRVASMMQRQVNQMARLIDDLLDVSRLTTGKVVLKKSVVPLGEVIASAVETVMPAIERLGHVLEIVLPPEPLPVEVDPHRLAQIVSNLLSNAAKYTPAGGRIQLEAAVEASPVIRIMVRDNGRGIPADLQQSIFDLFEQGDQGAVDGLGIGLTLVKSLTEMHGGRVQVTSGGAGAGSEFTLQLPVLAASFSATPEEAPLPARSGPYRVLVADDGRNAADVLVMFFQMEGFEAVAAYDGLEAVETAAIFQPDFAFVDLGMPKLDGYEAGRRIRALRKSVVLVALSGWGSEEHKRRTAEAGFDLHLVKPVNPAELRKAMAGLLQDT